MDIIDFKSEFGPFLQDAMNAKFDQYSRYTQDPDILAIIHQAKKVIGGGKCVRPYIAYILYTTLGGQDKHAVLNILVALEIFHAFALIHDDVIDEGMTRHDQETVHVFAKRQLQHRVSPSNVVLDSHYGNSQAILVGDMLFAWSLARFQSYSYLDYHQEAWDIFTQMIDEVVVGQMIDVDIMKRDDVDTELIETKMKLKTAGYTFVRPMQIGVALAGKLDQYTDFCYSFGQAIGLAFQTQDDILDIIADPNIVKKSILTDIRDHQHTYLTQYVLENGSKEDKDQLMEWWGSSDITQSEVIDLFTRTGALEYAQAKTQSYFAQARQICKMEANLPEKTKTIIEGLIDYIAKRSY